MVNIMVLLSYFSRHWYGSWRTDERTYRQSRDNQKFLDRHRWVTKFSKVSELSTAESLTNLTERFPSVSMQDSSQELPSFRCFLPVELDDRASWHKTRHRKRENFQLLSPQKLSGFCFDGHLGMLPHAMLL